MDLVKDLLRKLPLEDQEELHAYLTRLVTPAQVEHAPLVATVRTRARTETYRAEMVRCGKAGCACREGKLHGPYVYKYWREDGRLRKAYVGKRRLPQGAPLGSPRPLGATPQGEP